MSQTELIKQGLILNRKQQRFQAVADAKAALRALINEATYAQDKPVAEMNTVGLQAHLTRLMENQETTRRLDDEIAELEY
ncbi:MAG: hypothetical protein HZA15_15500 [Nitrospirae bacterium]|nr:hypothetical protein [Nitrospirota bacterium]